MFKNFLKVSLRNLMRNKAYSFINILGLSVGLACSILISLFILDELSYDKYHNDAENIYRLGIDANLQGEQMKAFITGAPSGRVFTEALPEIKKFVRLVHIQFGKSEAIVKYGEKKFLEEKLFYADSTFFDFFAAEFIYGKPIGLLSKPFTVVLTESVSVKYFGNENPVGKSIHIMDNEYLVEAVVKDCPANTHFHYNFLIPIVGTPVENSETWMTSDNAYTYLFLEKGTDVDLLEKKITKISEDYIITELEKVFGLTRDQFFGGGSFFNYLLQPLTDIHLKSHTDYEIEPNSNIIYVYIFAVIAIFILWIAIINFMNLSTAKSATRAKEVGIRKVVGATRKNLFSQFLFESVIMSLISLIVAMVLIESILPFFNNYTLKSISIGYFSKIWILPALISTGVFVGVISGIYSAGFLSFSKILTVLHGKILTSKSKSWFRNGLVIFQFSVSIALFICTFILYSQLSLLRNKDIGFEKKNILVVERANLLENSFLAFKEKLQTNAKISHVAFSSTLPAKIFSGLPCAIEGDEIKKAYAPRTISIGSDFADTYELKLKEGRFFSEDFRTDTFAVLLNESAVKEFEIEKPVVGKRLVTSFYGNRYVWEIIGVVNNFNFRSLHQEVGSLIMTSPFISGVSYASVKLDEGIEPEVVNFIKKTWDEFVPEVPFDYYIMEEDFDSQHKEEFRTGNIFLVFSILAIFIACLGLFGLASFMAENKTKEIGIRKALGASTLKILHLLIKQFTKWVLWANVLAWPVAYFFMKNWLQNFAYQTEIKWWFFILSGLAGLFIAVFTVSYQALKSASANPVDSLRYE